MANKKHYFLEEYSPPADKSTGGADLPRSLWETRGHEPWEARWQLEKGVCPRWGPLCLARTGTKQLQWDHPLRISQKRIMLSHFSHVWLCVTLWTIALQAPLSIGFSRQEYWGSSQLRVRTHVSHISCISRQVLYHWRHLGSPNEDKNVKACKCSRSVVSDSLWPHEL